MSDDSLWRRPGSSDADDVGEPAWPLDEPARRSLDPRPAEQWAASGTADTEPTAPVGIVRPPVSGTAAGAPPAGPAVTEVWSPVVAAGDDTPTGELPAVVDPTPVHGAPLPGRAARRRRRWWVWTRRVLLGLLALTVLGAAYFGVTLYQVWSAGRHDQARAVDAIVVMGAANYDGRPSPLLQARLDHALELYNAKLARYIVVTGGKQPGDRFTEAAASRRYLVRKGVADTAILSEDTGRSTWQSLEAVSTLLRKRFPKPRVLIVTDPFHSLRCRLIAGEVHLSAWTSPTRTSPWGSSTQFKHSLKEAAGISVGRIIGFHRLWKVTG